MVQCSLYVLHLALIRIMIDLIELIAFAREENSLLLDKLSVLMAYMKIL